MVEKGKSSKSIKSSNTSSLTKFVCNIPVALNKKILNEAKTLGITKTAVVNIALSQYFQNKEDKKMYFKAINTLNKPLV